MRCSGGISDLTGVVDKAEGPFLPETVAVIAFRFPPYAGVGGHRWSKLSTYLARLGHEVHVVTVDWAQVGKPSSVGQAERSRISIHYVPPPVLFGHRYPTEPATPIQRLVRTAIRRGVDPLLFWDDEVQRWGETLRDAVAELVMRYRPTVVIATGGPFQVIRHIGELKRHNSQIRFIADLRDPWFQQRQASLGHRRSAKIRRWAAEALESADAIVCVTEGLAREYEQIVPGRRIEVIPNGVDLEDLPAYSDECRWDLVHAGNVTNKRSVPARLLLEALVRIAPLTRVLFVGSGLASLGRYRAHLPNLELRSATTRTEALAEVAASRYGLHLNAPHVPYAVSTKIYEYPAIGVPVLSINYGGDSDRLVRNEGWGRSIDVQRVDLDAALCEALSLPRGRIEGKHRYSHAHLALAYSALIAQTSAP